MKKRQQQQVDSIRRQSSEVQNHLIDEYSYGKIGRREFIRRGSIAGLSLPFLGILAAACGEDEGVSTTAAGPATTAAGPATTAAPATTEAPMEPVTVRVGINNAPAVGIEPVLINDEAGLATLGQGAEYLVFSDDELSAVPVLAESWEQNDAGDVWTFKIRQGVTFNDGTPLTADDVVATFNGPIGTGNASSAYETFFVTAGAAAEKVDDFTVRFTLTSPNGAFPFFVSSDNYNAAILPKAYWDSYAEGLYEQSFIGTGAWINDSYDPGVSAVYTKNPNYWGDNSAQPDRMEITYFADEAATVTAFQDDRLDVVHRISASGAEALLDDPNAKVLTISTAGNRQVYMDTSKPPFQDKRVRQAMGLVLNRPNLIEGLLAGFGDVGNDHPIWKFFPMYNPDAVPQREENIAMAQQLLTDAGFADGFTASLDAVIFNEVEDLAQLIQTSAAQIGVTLDVGVYDTGTYYGDYWLAADASMGIVNYGHRGVPNVYLGAPLLSDGSWNASKWVNTDYDALFAQFVSAPDLDTQRGISGQIQQLLNDEVPFVMPYFVGTVSVAKPNFEGWETTGMGHFSVVDSGFSS